MRGHSMGCWNWFLSLFPKREKKKVRKPLWPHTQREPLLGESHIHWDETWDQGTADAGISTALYVPETPDAQQEPPLFHNPRGEHWNSTLADAGMSTALLVPDYPGGYRPYYDNDPRSLQRQLQQQRHASSGNAQTHDKRRATHSSIV